MRTATDLFFFDKSANLKHPTSHSRIERYLTVCTISCLNQWANINGCTETDVLIQMSSNILICCDMSSPNISQYVPIIPMSWYVQQMIWLLKYRSSSCQEDPQPSKLSPGWEPGWNLNVAWELVTWYFSLLLQFKKESLESPSFQDGSNGEDGNNLEAHMAKVWSRSNFSQYFAINEVFIQKWARIASTICNFLLS